MGYLSLIERGGEEKGGRGYLGGSWSAPTTDETRCCHQHQRSLQKPNMSISNMSASQT